VLSKVQNINQIDILARLTQTDFIFTEKGIQKVNKSKTIEDTFYDLLKKKESKDIA
jgi:hypothetical protein